MMKQIPTTLFAVLSFHRRTVFLIFGCLSIFLLCVSTSYASCSSTNLGNSKTCLISTIKRTPDSANVTTTAADFSAVTDLIIVARSISAGNVAQTSDPTDSTGMNTYTKCGTEHTIGVATAGASVSIWYVRNPHVSASMTFTVTSITGFSSPTIAAFGINGTLTSGDPCDQANGATAAFQATINTGSITPSGSSPLIVAMVGQESATSWGTLSIDTGTIYEVADENGTASALGVMLTTQGSPSAINPQWSGTLLSNTNSAAAIASFSNAGGGGGGVATSKSLTGAGK
jgi:hypothetical protein